LKSSVLKKLAGETAIYGVSSILSRLLNYVILTPYLTRAFVTGQYGVVTDMYTYAGLLMVFFTYRMETTFFRFGSGSKEQMDKAFSTTSWSLLVTTSIFVSILLLFSQYFAELLRYPDHADYVIWFTLIIAFDALSAIPFARLRLENRPIRFAILKTLSIIINLVFIFFFLEACPWLIKEGVDWVSKVYDSEQRISYVFISNLLASGLVFTFLLPMFRKIKFEFDIDLWKKMLVYAMPLVIVGLAAVINQLISVPLMKYLLPGDDASNLSQIGIYGGCYKIAILMSLFTQAFNYAAEPFFFRNAKKENAKKTYAQVGQAFALVGSLAFLGIMLYLDLIQYFLDEAYRTGLAVVPLLLLAFFCLGMYYNFSIWFKLTDRTKYGAYISLGGVVVTLSLNFLLIPKIGYMGAAWAALACYAFMATVSYLIGQKFYPIAYPVKKILGYIGSAILVYYLSQLIDLSDSHMALRLLVSTVFLLLWLGGIYLVEGRNFRASAD